MRYCLLTLISIYSFAISAQRPDSLIQFSGIVVTSDSLAAIPFANIFVDQEHRGGVTNYNGFFSFVAERGDTIRFHAIGFKNESFIIPVDLRENKYSVIQLMTRDTIYLSETIIYPWPSREDFKQAFLSYNIPDDYYETARKNLKREQLKEMGEAMGMDADMNADYQTKQLAQKIYYAGQYPPMRIFDVMAWKQFIEAWRRGDFKSKE